MDQRESEKEIQSQRVRVSKRVYQIVNYNIYFLRKIGTFNKNKANKKSIKFYKYESKSGSKKEIPIQ